MKNKNLTEINIYTIMKNNNEECFIGFNSGFSISDYAPRQFRIEIKECLYIDWEEANLKKQLNHLTTTLSL